MNGKIAGIIIAGVAVAVGIAFAVNADFDQANLVENSDSAKPASNQVDITDSASLQKSGTGDSVNVSDSAETAKNQNFVIDEEGNKKYIIEAKDSPELEE